MAYVHIVGYDSEINSLQNIIQAQQRYNQYFLYMHIKFPGEFPTYRMLQRTFTKMYFTLHCCDSGKEIVRMICSVEQVFVTDKYISCHNTCKQHFKIKIGMKHFLRHWCLGGRRKRKSHLFTDETLRRLLYYKYHSYIFTLIFNDITYKDDVNDLLECFVLW